MFYIVWELFSDCMSFNPLSQFWSQSIVLESTNPGGQYQPLDGPSLQVNVLTKENGSNGRSLRK